MRRNFFEVLAIAAGAEAACLMPIEIVSGNGSIYYDAESTKPDLLRGGVGDLILKKFQVCSDEGKFIGMEFTLDRPGERKLNDPERGNVWADPSG